MDVSFLQNEQVPLAIILIFVGLIIMAAVKTTKLKELNKKMDAEYRAKPLEDIVAEFTKKALSTQEAHDRGQVLFEELQKRILSADKELSGIVYGIIPPAFSFEDSEELKNKIKACHERQLQTILQDKAVVSSITWTVHGSKKKGDQLIQAYRHLMLKAFNNEFDTIRKAMRHSTYDTASNKLGRLHKTITKLGEVASVKITYHYKHLKKDELSLWHEELERKQELKQGAKKQKAILREQAKLRLANADEIEDELDEKEEQLRRATEIAEKILGAEASQKSKEIKKLEAEITKLKKNQERALSQAQLTKAGYIYVISNIGCFGSDVVKIGMTRRLEPMDRVIELGDASVAFRFDVHTIAFNENAPAIEKQLHKKFHEFRVNKNNTRKEFFRVSPQQVADAMREMNIESDWYFEIEAKDYHESQLIREAEKVRKEQAAHYLGGLPETI